MESQVLTPAMLRCLASPTRSEIYSCLRTLGEASAREIAEALGKPPAGVHYHLAELAHVDLIREAFQRPGSRRPEAVYRPTAERVTLPKDDNPQTAELRRKAMLARMRLTMREFEAASKRADEEPAARGAMHVLHISTRLSPEDLRELHRMLEAVANFAKEHRQDDGLPVQWSSVSYPQF